MMLKLCLCLAVIAVGCPKIWTQAYTTPEPTTTTTPEPTTTTTPEPTTTTTPDPPTPLPDWISTIPEIGQLENMTAGETEYDDAADRDRDFDNKLLNQHDKPNTVVTSAEASSMFSREKSRLVQEAYSEGDIEAANTIQRASVSYSVTYYSYWDWYQNYDRCCPKSQNYGCRSYRSIRVPCFANCENGRKEWCCPLWNHYMANCNCNTCAILGNPFVQVGKCYRRYSRRSVVAVCVGADGVKIIRRIVLNLPTSCYCRAPKPDCCS